MHKMLVEGAAGVMEGKIRMIKRDKSKQEENLTKNSKPGWPVAMNSKVNILNGKSLIEKQASMEILSIITVYFNQLKTA